MNASSYGQDVELRAVETLRYAGYTVNHTYRGIHRTPMGPRSFQNDVFHLIDIIAKKKGERTRWIQVTASASIAEKRRGLHTGPWDNQYDSVEIWQWKPVNEGPRSKETHELLEGSYFQVYSLEEDFAKIPSNRQYVPTKRQLKLRGHHGLSDSGGAMPGG